MKRKANANPLRASAPKRVKKSASPTAALAQQEPRAAAEPNVDGTAAQRVFKTTELLEMIILELHPSDILLSCNRVSRRWHAVCQSSTPILEALYFIPFKADRKIAAIEKRSRENKDKAVTGDNAVRSEHPFRFVNWFLFHRFPNFFHGQDYPYSKTSDTESEIQNERIVSSLMYANRVKPRSETQPLLTAPTITQSRTIRGKLQYYVANKTKTRVGGYFDQWTDARYLRHVPLELLSFHERNPSAVGPPKRLKHWTSVQADLNIRYPVSHQLVLRKNLEKYLPEHQDDNSVAYRVLGHCNSDDPFLRKEATWQKMMPYTHPAKTVRVVIPKIATYVEEYKNSALPLRTSVKLSADADMGITMGELYDLGVRYASVKALTLVWARPVWSYEKEDERNADLKLVVNHVDMPAAGKQCPRRRKLLEAFVPRGRKLSKREERAKAATLRKGLEVEGVIRQQIGWERRK